MSAIKVQTNTSELLPFDLQYHTAVLETTILIIRLVILTAAEK